VCHHRQQDCQWQRWLLSGCLCMIPSMLASNHDDDEKLLPLLDTSNLNSMGTCIHDAWTCLFLWHLPIGSDRLGCIIFSRSRSCTGAKNETGPHIFHVGFRCPDFCKLAHISFPACFSLRGVCVRCCIARMSVHTIFTSIVLRTLSSWLWSYPFSSQDTPLL
jgi:hypothetical protein